MVMERRKERRLRANVPVKIIYNGSEFSGTTRNISNLGAYVETSREVPLGAEIEITLHIPRAKILCSASIFRSNAITRATGQDKYGLGLFFTHFDSIAEEAELQDYLDSLIAKEEQEAKRSLKNWSNKRDIQKASRRQKIPDKETAVLLENILARLEEICILLRSGSSR